jgi:ABC-type phosphate transport system substrate-binding protein
MIWIGTTTTFGVAKDPILTVIVNRSNPVDSVSNIELRALLLGKMAQWPNKQPVILVERESTSPTFQRTLKLVLHMSEGEYERWILQEEFRGEKPPLIKTLNSDEGAGKFVFYVPGAIAITDGVPSLALSSEIKVLRVDGKLPGDAGYPLK